MNDEPKVTIIVISYNEKRYLRRAIDSCLNQTYENIEIIIGDDGSTDGSIEFISDICTADNMSYYVMPRDEDPKMIIPSIRVSNNIKEGIDRAKGDYIVILSGDDYFIDSNMLSDAVGFLDEHSSYYAYVSGFSNCTDKKDLGTVKPFFHNTVLFWSGQYNHISTFVFRKMDSSTLLDRMCDDTGLQFVLANNGKWKCSKKVTFAYYQREKSIMHDADRLELSILELLIYQDILNYKCHTSRVLKLATEARYFKPYFYVLLHKNELKKWRYNKYLLEFRTLDNNPIDDINRKRNCRKLFPMGLYWFNFTVVKQLIRIGFSPIRWMEE